MGKHEHPGPHNTADNPRSGHGGKHEGLPTRDRGRTDADKLLRGGQQGARDAYRERQRNEESGGKHRQK